MSSILAVLVALLGIWNVLLGQQKRKTEKKLRESEDRHHAEKLEAVQKERELARKRLRGLLDNYRGPGNGKA